MPAKIVMTICILLLLSSILSAQESYVEISSWEPEDIVPIYSMLDTADSYVIRPSILIANRVIKFYERKISTQSISRCPFYISCSEYAYQALRKHGLILGICFFIDRHFYRENATAYFHYELRETKTGVLKLDDSFYLYGKEKP